MAGHGLEGGLFGVPHGQQDGLGLQRLANLEHLQQMRPGVVDAKTRQQLKGPLLADEDPLAVDHLDDALGLELLEALPEGRSAYLKALHPLPHRR